MAGADQDPGQRPSTADELLSDLMQAGSLLDQHQEQGNALDAAREDIAARRDGLEEERAAAERAIADDFNGRAGQLGMEAEELRDEERRLKQRRGRAQSKVGKLEGQLRELASDPEADRSTVVAYAAFVATKPNFTATAVQKMGELDEAVREAAGQPFALVQGHNFAFGKIDKEAEGLAVDTGEEARDAIALPVARTNPVKHARRKPYFGFFSQSFDHPRDLHDAYEWVLGRYADEDDVIKPNAIWSTMSHFILEEGDLPLDKPMAIQVADPGKAPSPSDPEEEENGFWGRDNVLFTGPAARAFLHRVVDARLTSIQDDHESAEASTEMGRFMSIAARLDLRVDPREIPVHQDLIGI